MQKFIDRFAELASRRKSVILWIAALFFASFVLFSNYGIVKMLSLELKKREFIDLIKREEYIADSLNKEIKRLKTDTLEIERIAREKYGMVKRGETIYFYIEEEEDE